MKLVIGTVFFNCICIIIFTYIYYLHKAHYYLEEGKDLTLIDSLLLSTTIQSSVGVNTVVPTTNTGKIIMIIQQFILVITYVFVIYLFSSR